MSFGYLIDLPTKVLFGAGKIAELGNQAAAFGKKAFVMLDPFLKGSATAQKVFDILKSAGLDYVDCYEVSPNPRTNVVDECAKKCADEKCDCVIAIGGGSCIDSGKAIAIVAKNNEPSWLFTARVGEYVAEVKEKPLPVISVPTTSGTGTEVTPYSVLNNLSLHCKGCICNMACCPTVSIVDPELTATMPPQITALTGIDAFAHAFESYINRNATPFSEMLSLEVIRLFARSIRTAVKDGSNIEARSDMSLASMLAGAAIAHSSTTMPHGMGQPLSGLTDAPHGGSIACCICQIIEWTLPCAEDKFAVVAEIFDPSIKDLPVSEKAQKLPAILRQLWKDILPTEVTMSSYGLKPDQIETVADMMLKFYALDLGGHPKAATKEDLIGIITKCM